jgi:hypothetical protein
MRTLRLFSLALLLVSGIAVGCRKKSMTLEFVVPNDFRGILTLRGGSAKGIEVAVTNGLISLVFPTSGILEVKSKLPTLEWHKPVARYADGKPIPIPGPAASVADDVVALRGLGMKNNNTESWYLVGTADQMQDAMNKFYGFKVPKQ